MSEEFCSISHGKYCKYHSKDEYGDVCTSKGGCPPEHLRSCEGCPVVCCLEQLEKNGVCLVCGKQDCTKHLPAKGQIEFNFVKEELKQRIGIK